MLIGWKHIAGLVVAVAGMDGAEEQVDVQLLRMLPGQFFRELQGRPLVAAVQLRQHQFAVGRLLRESFVRPVDRAQGDAERR